MDGCLKDLGAPEWSEEDYELASSFLRTYSKPTLQNIKEDLIPYYGDMAAVEEVLRRPLDSGIHAYDPSSFRYESGSTDVGDVAYATPTVQVNVATACIGCVWHSWQTAAFSGSSIGKKGMIRAAEVMALAAVRTMPDTQLMQRAKKELTAKNGGRYTCPLPEYVQPPIGRY